VQVSSGKPTIRVDAALMARVESILKDGKIETHRHLFDTTGLNSRWRARLPRNGRATAGQDTLQRALNPNPDDPSYVVRLNLISNTPSWLKSLHALPMYLGLDLRGGVHFLLQVDMRAAVDKRLETSARTPHAAAREEHPPRRHKQVAGRDRGQVP